MSVTDPQLGTEMPARTGPAYAWRHEISPRKRPHPLPDGRGIPLFAITTAAYASGDTAWYATRSLEHRGYDPFLLANVLMPNHFFIPPMAFLPIPSHLRIACTLERAQRKIERLAWMIHTRTRHVEGMGWSGRLLGMLQRWGMDRYSQRLFVSVN